MACLDMFNNEQHQNGRLVSPPSTTTTMSPRISFSNDFVDAQQMIAHEKRTTDQSVVGSSDFEFSVTNYNMMAADELFSKGRLLPFKPGSSSSNHFQPKMTLREELLQDDDEGNTGRGTSSSSSRPPKGPRRWKELLGLKKTHIVSKKADKEAHASNNSQEMSPDEGSEVEI